MIRKLSTKLKKFHDVHTKYGIAGITKLAVNFPLKRMGFDLYPSKKVKKRNVLDPYLFISQELLLHERTSDKQELQINRDGAKAVLNWIIPDFGQGSGGGHINIFRFISYLEKHGIKNNIYIFSNERFFFDLDRTVLDYKRDIKKYFGDIQANIYRWSDYCEDADAVVATCWETAYPAYSMKNVKKHLYFVQDFEPYFFPHSSDYIFAENTYKMGFTGITAGSWLKHKLQREYDMECISYSFAADQMYKRKSLDLKQKNRIFFYARPPTVRRAFELGILGLQLFNRQHPEVEIVTAGWNINQLEVPFKHKDLGVIKYDKLPDFYQSCDIGLILSLTNCSLLPSDLMASGCLTVSNRGENNEWLVKDGINGLITDPDPLAIARTLSEAYTNRERRESLITQAHQSIMHITWEDEYEQVRKKIIEMVQ
ncbi:MAG: glycosyltransferase [Patescibacteria group bacterium]